MAAAWSELEEYAARLALVVHCARWVAGDARLGHMDVFDSASMNVGARLAAWFKREARRVGWPLHGTSTERDQRLTEWIGRQGRPTAARDARIGCDWLKEAGKAEAPFDDLAKTGLGRWCDVPPTGRGGRPRSSRRA